jgi:hypothetical protein
MPVGGVLALVLVLPLATPVDSFVVLAAPLIVETDLAKIIRINHKARWNMHDSRQF